MKLYKINLGKFSVYLIFKSVLKMRYFDNILGIDWGISFFLFS